MDPALAEKELEDYREILSAAGVKEGRTAVEKVFAEYRKLLGVSAAEGVPEDPEILLQPKKATLDELAGSDALPPVNPIMDIIRGGMLKFYVEIHAYDMGNRKTPWRYRKQAVRFPSIWEIKSARPTGSAVMKKQGRLRKIRKIFLSSSQE